MLCLGNWIPTPPECKRERDIERRGERARERERERERVRERERERKTEGERESTKERDSEYELVYAGKFHPCVLIGTAHTEQI